MAEGRRARIAGVSALLACLALPSLLLGNGGTLRVADAPVGDYRVSVYTDPTPPRPDSVDVSVLVVRAGDPTPVPDLDIVVRAAPVETAGADAARVLRASRSEADDPRYYAAKFAPGREGPWRFEVEVAGPEGRGTVAFEVRIRQPGLLDRPWVVVALALIPLALLSFWLFRAPGDEDPGAGRPREDRQRPVTPPSGEG